MADRPTVYIETSVISYLVARPSRDAIVAGHQVSTAEWWDKELPRFQAFVSQYVLDEAEKGDSAQALRRIGLLEPFPFLPLSPEAERLSQIYVQEKLIPESEQIDSMHLAIATYHGIGYLVTWNCRHLASAAVRQRIAAINLREGFQTPVICTPEELMEF